MGSPKDVTKPGRTVSSLTWRISNPSSSTTREIPCALCIPAGKLKGAAIHEHIISEAKAISFKLEQCRGCNGKPQMNVGLRNGKQELLLSTFWQYHLSNSHQHHQCDANFKTPSEIQTQWGCVMEKSLYCTQLLSQSITRKKLKAICKKTSIASNSHPFSRVL